MPQAIYMQKDQDQDLENLIIISKTLLRYGILKSNSDEFILEVMQKLYNKQADNISEGKKLDPLHKTKAIFKKVNGKKNKSEFLEEFRATVFIMTNLYSDGLYEENFDKIVQNHIDARGKITQKKFENNNKWVLSINDNNKLTKLIEPEDTSEKSKPAKSISEPSLILKDQQDKILSEFGCKDVVGFWDFIVENYEKYVDLSKEMCDREYLIVAKKINKEVINLFYINFELCPGPSDWGHDFDRGGLAASAQICYDGEAGHKIKERTEEELNAELGFDLFEWFD